MAATRNTGQSVGTVTAYNAATCHWSKRIEPLTSSNRVSTAASFRSIEEKRLS